MYIVIDSLKTLVYALTVYTVLIFGYSLTSDAATCLNSLTVYASTVYGGQNTYPVIVFTSGSSVDNTCDLIGISYGDYQNFINSANSINVLNTNFSNLQTSVNSSIDAINSNQQQLNANISTVSGVASQASTAANSASALAQNAIDNSPLNNPNNILNISSDDALTLSAAITGLFVAAFVGRYIRKALDTDNSVSSDS